MKKDKRDKDIKQSDRQENIAQRNPGYLPVCYLTAFAGGFCVMVVELIAGRLVARYLGVSLYTWTSVIGVVLAGISLGNYVGGRIADRFHPRKAISMLFILASISCAFVPLLNNLIGSFSTSTHLSFPWPVRVTMYVAVIFFLPSAFLGMISPVVAKFALDQGSKTGRTIGNIYAFSAAGSILGTFITGFFLISHMGVVAIAYTIAGFLGLIGLLYGIRNTFSYIWLVFLVFLCFISFSPMSWANIMATQLFLVETPKGDIIYEKDSNYSYIRIKGKHNSNVYNFMLDNLTQTTIKIDEPTNLKYASGYYRIFAHIVENLSPDKEDLSFLFLGGGGYLFPRYIEEYHPASRIEVVEIDPEVTNAAVGVFGLSRDSSIRIHHMDARNYIEDLFRGGLLKEEVLPFDLIFCDVFSGGLAVPYHLTTYEFNEKIARVLSPEGLYVINLIDSKASPRFLWAMIDTLKKSFHFTYVFGLKREKYTVEGGRLTYVIMASQREIDNEVFDSERFNARLMTDAELHKDVSEQLILTDDFAPVDTLLAEVFRWQGVNRVCTYLIDAGVELIKENRLDEGIAQFKKVLSINPNFKLAHVNIGTVYARQGNYDQAVEYYEKALSIEDDFKPALIGLGKLLELTGRLDEAIEKYQQIIEIDPEPVYTYMNLGNVLFKQGKIDEAIESYKLALEIDPGSEIVKRNLNMAIMRKNEMRKGRAKSPTGVTENERP